jgi:hypothetical protein
MSSKTLLDDLEEIDAQVAIFHTASSGSDEDDTDDDCDNGELDYGYGPSDDEFAVQPLDPLYEELGRESQEDTAQALHDSSNHSFESTSVTNTNLATALAQQQHGSFQTSTSSLQLDAALRRNSQRLSFTRQHQQHLQQRRSSVSSDMSSPYDLSSHNSSMRSPVSPQRRPVLYRPSITGSIQSESSSIVESDSSSGGGKKRRFTRKFGTRRSTRQQQQQQQRANQMDSNNNSFRRAVDHLGSSSTDYSWTSESVAAAAAVVRSSAQVPTRRRTQFARGDCALVLVTLLNHMMMMNGNNNNTNRSCDWTVDPVNAAGFPAGAGTTEHERTGPYAYVLCVVHTVHFDEDERYYTIVRMDSGTEQRADPGWMVPCGSEAAVERARAAAQRTATTRNAAVEPPATRRRRSSTGVFGVWVVARWIPGVAKSRAAVKRILQNLMHGRNDDDHDNTSKDDRFVLRMQCTAINALVGCSFVFLFLDVVALAVLPAELDPAVAIVVT